MRKLIYFLKPHWKSALLAPLLMLVEVAMDLMQPMLMAKIINDGVQKAHMSTIYHTGMLMIGIAIIGLIGGIGCAVFSSIASQKFGADLREAAFDKVQTFSFHNLDQFKTGSLVTRLTNDIVQLQTLVMMTLRTLVRTPFLAVGSLIMALIISPRLGLIFLVVIPALMIALFFLFRYAFPLFSTMQRKMDKINTVLQENFAGIRIVKAFVRGAYEHSRFQKANTSFLETAMKATRTIALNMPIMTLLLNGSIVTVLWFGGHHVWNGTMEVGDLVAFINYMTQMLFSLLMASMMMVNISRAKVAAERVNEVLDVSPDIINQPEAKPSAVQQGKVEFRGVYFRYGSSEQEYALSNISFTAYPGQTIAILGPTGAGKSSLVSLIPRLYDATKGEIFIDGTSVRDIELHHLRTQISVVLQEAILFSGTIRDNIRFGMPNASEEQVVAAAKAAQAHEFISQMPNGYDTRVGQRGVNLSGGQKQRISIARALLMNPSILILDDSTSAVDAGTEARILQTLKQLECTTFMIAQRISSVTEADCILLLEEGKIIAQGTHEQLMCSSSVYQDIYRSQLGKEEAIYG